MADKNTIALVDVNGEVHWFEPASLGIQLVNYPELIGDCGALRAAARNFAGHVKEMRTNQKRYFANRKVEDKNFKMLLLNQAKKHEERVDKMVPIFIQTLDKI